MKKIKKIGLIAATTATITSPLPFLVSCGFFTSDKQKEQGIKATEPKQPVHKAKPASIPWTDVMPAQVVKPMAVDTETKTQQPIDKIPYIKLTPAKEGLRIMAWIDVDETTNIKHIPWTDLNDTVPSLQWYALKDPISVPWTSLNEPTTVRWTSLNEPTGKTIPWTKLDPSKSVINWTALNHSMIVIPWTDVDGSTNVMTIPWTKIDLTTNKTVIPWTDIDQTTNHFEPIPWTELKEPIKVPWTTVNLPTKMPFIALNQAKVTIPWTKLNPSKVTVVWTEVDPTTNVKSTQQSVPTISSTPWTDIDTATNVKHTAWTDVDPNTNIKHIPWTDVDATTNVKSAQQVAPTISSTPWTDVDASTNVKHTAWTDVDPNTNIKYIPWTDVDITTNIKHTAWTDIDTTTNVKHTAWTNVDATTNVKPAAATSNAQSLYVGKKMPVSGSTPIASQYKANYVGSDLFGQQLKMWYNMDFNKTHLKGLYLGYSSIKPDPNSVYAKPEEWFADLDAIVAEMNKESDISWHAIGEPFVDALNAVRYTIKKSAQGDSHLVPHLRNIVEKMWWDRGLKAKTTTRGSDFTSNATVDINDWLLGKTQLPVIPSDNFAPAWGNPNDNYLNPRHIRVASDLATMKAVRFSEDMQKWSQYRAQQNEWRGSFDDHMVQQTTIEIGQHAGAPKGNLMNPNTKAPVVQQIPAYWAGENYVNYGALDQTNLSDEAKWHKASEMNIYRAVGYVLQTLYDETDYTQTGGHRYPMFDPKNDLVGYSMTFEALSGKAIGSNANFAAAVPFIITEMWDSSRSDAPKGRISTYVQDGYDDKFSTVLPYDLLGSGSLSIYYDGAERQATIDRLFTQK